MKKNTIEVPKETNSTLNGMQKVMYTIDDEDNFITQKYGSKIEEFATKTAVEEYLLLQEKSLENIKRGVSSPIEYFMYKNRMDLPTIASKVGMFQFRIKRHLKMNNFLKLSDKILLKYAEAFNIELSGLKNFNYEK